MNRNFESKEIIKVLDAMVGRTEAVGETREDKRRLDNLKTLIDITNWCMDGVRFAMESGKGRQESSMHEISWTAQLALDEYRTWLTETLEAEGE